MHRLYCGKHEDILKTMESHRWDTIFMDPPDNLSLNYDKFDDTMTPEDYKFQLGHWVRNLVPRTSTLWISFNARWTAFLGGVIEDLLGAYSGLQFKPCQQVITFYQHNSHDLGNAHRPLYRLHWDGAPRFPDQIRIESERQKQGDKRANPLGKVPGDVFEFPRVVGNSKQRRSWHPTQIHEGLVERCLKFSTPEGGTVLDPFAGTGTVLRVCKRLGYNCDSMEFSPNYCKHIADENSLNLSGLNYWEGI